MGKITGFGNFTGKKQSQSITSEARGQKAEDRMKKSIFSSRTCPAPARYAVTSERD
jgi:hypothetical protein